MITAVHLYRAGHWFNVYHTPILPRFVYAMDYLLFNASVPASAKIGKGTRFGYRGMGVVIRENCMIGQQVTIGGRSHILDHTNGDDLAQDLMDRGLVACTASDAHDATRRPPVVLHHSFGDLRLS